MQLSDGGVSVLVPFGGGTWRKVLLGGGCGHLQAVPREALWGISPDGHRCRGVLYSGKLLGHVL